MNKMLKYGRFLIALVVVVFATLAFVGHFYPIRFFNPEFGALCARLLADISLSAVVGAIFMIAGTLLFGRIYCSTLCPFGTLQEILMIIFRRPNKLQKSRPYKYFISAVAFGFLIGGTTIVLRFIEPYTLFGSALSGAVLGISAVMIVAVLVWFKGRVFCSNICPVGAILGLLAKYSLLKIRIDSHNCGACGLCARSCPMGCIDSKNKKVDNEICIKCFKCLGSCKNSALSYSIEPSKEPEFCLSRREFLKGGLVLLAFGAAAKAGVRFGNFVTEKIKKIIVPAGAQSPQDLANKCLNCNLCVENCPMKIIKKANREYPAIHIEYGSRFCRFNCHRCSEVCPSGAIKKISPATKQKTQIGLASVNTDICIKCGICAQECPKKIIKYEFGAYPQIDSEACIGCGKCQSVCPVKAVRVEPVERQKILTK